MIRKLMQLFRPQASRSGGWYEPLLVESPGLGPVVTPRSAMRHPIVFQCVNIIAGDMGMMPLHKMVRRGEEDVIDSGHWIEHLFNVGPNDIQTYGVWMENAMRDVLLWGNHCSAIVRLPDGGAELLPLNPDNTYYQWNRDLQMYFIRTTLNNGAWALPYHSVFHIRHLPWEAAGETGGSGFWGIDIVRVLNEIIGGGLELIRHGNAVMGNSANPGGVITLERQMSKEAVTNFRSEWYNQHGGSVNAGRVALLEPGMAWHAITTSNKDLQLIDQRTFDRQLQATIFNLPSFKVNGWENASTRANVEESQIEYIQSVLGRWMHQFVHEIHRKMFSISQVRTDRTWMEFYKDHVLMPTKKERYEIGAIGISNKMITRNEFRKSERLPPVEGGDEFENPQPGADPSQTQQQTDPQQQPPEEQNDETEARIRDQMEHQTGLFLKAVRGRLQSGVKSKDFQKWLRNLREELPTMARQYYHDPCAVAQTCGVGADYRQVIEDFGVTLSCFWSAVDDAGGKSNLILTAKQSEPLFDSVRSDIVSRIMEPSKCLKISMSTT